MDFQLFVINNSCESISKIYAKVLSIILNVILFLVHCQISSGSWTQGKVNATLDCLEVGLNKIIWLETVYCSSCVLHWCIAQSGPSDVYIPLIKRKSRCEIKAYIVYGKF